MGGDEMVKEVMFEKDFDGKKESGEGTPYAAYFSVRREVFCVEQQVSIDDELDGEDESCRHFALFQGDRAIAVCRLHVEAPFAKLGRVACLKSERGRGYARRLMLEMIRVCRRDHPTELLVAHAQTTVLPFYERLGFITVSREFLDEVDILHRTIVFPPRRASIRDLSLWTSSIPHGKSTFNGDVYDEEVGRTIKMMLEEIESLSFIPLTALCATLICSLTVTSSLHDLLARTALRVQYTGHDRKAFADGYTPTVPKATTVEGVADIDFLKGTAFKKLNTGHYSEVDENWRHFYSLLYLTLALSNREDAKKCLRQLDRGLLMGRDSDGILSALAEKISTTLSNEVMDFERLPVSTSTASARSPALAVPILQYPVDDIQFLEEYLIPGKPVLIRGAIKEWPATGKWSFPWFLANHGQRTVPVEIGSKYTDDDWSQRLMTIEQFSLQAVGAESSRPLYLAQHRLLDQCPSLRKDVDIPSLCLAGSSSPEDVDLNFWMGLADTVSPLHTDPRENIFCQVIGTKFVRLVSPSLAGQVGAYEEGILTNTSDVDAETMVNVECWDAEVQAGDALFIPRQWWHFVRALTPSISVSCWFDQ